MDPNISHYVYLYGAVVLLIIVYLLWRPSKNKPSRLKLRDEGSKNLPQRSTGQRASAVAPEPGQDYRNAPETTGRIERELNVIFQFNGHDFDAYEVFKVPAGSNIAVVQAAYENILLKTDSQSRGFYEVAFRAILQKSSGK